ncbi:MAG: HAMP domain-containing sensor histidine kinase, partial [Pseudomonadota bacterium]
NIPKRRFGIFALALVALCAAIIASYLLKRTVAGPMRQLSVAAENVTHNIRTAEDLPKFDDREDEVGQLARSFNTMTSALLRRIDASEKFAADIAHELKNPLTAARSTAESLAYAKTDSQRAELIEQIQQELKRLNKLITDVSNASRMDAELARYAPEPVDLAFIATNVCNVFRDIADDRGKKLELHYDRNAARERAYVVAGHEGRLAQVLTNVIDNANPFHLPMASLMLVSASKEQKLRSRSAIKVQALNLTSWKQYLRGFTHTAPVNMAAEVTIQVLGFQFPAKSFMLMGGGSGLRTAVNQASAVPTIKAPVRCSSLRCLH